MHKRTGLCLTPCLIIALSSCANNNELLNTASQVAQQVAMQGSGNSLSQTDIVAGLKEALSIGADHVVARLGTVNGFSADPKVHIPLPAQLQKAQQIAAKFGMDKGFNDLETRLNHAAELATPKAKALFKSAITQMTLADARQILNGPDDAATRYFQSKMSSPLATEMRPIVANSLSQVGAVQTYQQLVNGLGPIQAMLPDLKADLTAHVVNKGMEGIFYYLAQEEAEIRRNPAKRTTELLRKVFGNS